VPLVPGAVRIAVLQPADERECRALERAAGAELQRRVVIEELCGLPDAAQRLAVTDERALAVAADGERGGRRAELDRRAAIRARGAVRARWSAVGHSPSGLPGTPPPAHSGEIASAT